ncbi:MULTISPECIES: DUF1028 domain-containing protein [Achromobacter]|uniref:Fimbrial assembly protein FimA n=1 Tax=Achromobacter dolens TaxID=1287738 RepID=A0A6S7DUJ6_9BURK|nr:MULTISPECIES: DUF1028 domain-containing protein [Achromobacter]MCV6795157.1 DUF1028 domain-containing protein [Achromobacter ruhlandii]MCV6802018.1 DUF1028 domain-containing protein [Achromobacter ruhlandii]MCV6806998.1 DUF1028 domain-containing protein [Achromobacter ruhlandii]MCV6818740.1 DUF1028 domain-containing protein [Achromobacter ruhlandii]PJM89440.1 DUF1028 domain-containing protein [Achromobacter ruhlandii]
MTFSIIARCPASGQFGAAVSSSSPAVASRCVRVRAGVGAAVSQNITDPALGPMALDLMAAGQTPAQALEQLRQRPFIDYRQLMAIDASHPPAIFTGASALGTLAAVTGEHAACAGNMLASPGVPGAMLAAFEQAEGVLAERLMQALLAGQAAGGEAGPVHSAGLLVCQDLDWPMVDLRLDWVEERPVEALYAVWKVYEPQIPAYLTRARDPRDAPSFGVPGDL